MARLDDDAGSRSLVRIPRARTTGALLAAFTSLLVGCGGSNGSKPPVDGAIDVDGPSASSWWQPKVGEAKNWDIQLSGTIDTSTPRLMYDLDLWSLVPSPMTLDYGDGNPISVPAGTLAGKIAELHARTPAAIVICHVETGLLEMTRPDAPKFPGYNVDPKKIPDNPDNPAPGTVTGNPAAGSVIGWSLGAADLRFLDVREASRPLWASIMFKRFDLARSIGCDGVEPGHNDVEAYTSGFTIPTPETYSWYTEVANQGHDRMLSTGMKNGDTLAGTIDTEADKFDWLMTERCGEFGTCDASRPFINLHKAVFAIDYDHDSDGLTQSATVVCMQQGLAMIADGLVKDVALTKAVRTQCEP